MSVLNELIGVPGAARMLMDHMSAVVILAIVSTLMVTHAMVSLLYATH